MSSSERKNILKQMKVRTTYKKDKSWIHQQNSEDERDNPGPLSPQLQSLEGKKIHWSPNLDSNTEGNSETFTAQEVIISSSPPPGLLNKNSGTFTAQEVITSSSPPPGLSSNKQFSYNSYQTNKPASTTSQPSPPPPTAGAKTPSYIIRGQPVNSTSQVKVPPSFNGYQKSYSSVQPRTSKSLPRVPTSTGHKMSTEEYKKLAPYNVKHRSGYLSDDETPYTPQVQATRTEQASSVLKNTSSRDRSYVISAAKRDSGTGTQDTSAPFVAKRVQIQEEETSPSKKRETLPKTLSSYLHEDNKRVQIQEEETSPSKKSETLPKTLSSYLYEDNKRFENHWKDTQSKQAPSQAAPSGSATDGPYNPKLTSYSTSNVVQYQSKIIKPEPAKITVVRLESNNSDKSESKPAAQREQPASPATTRKESNNSDKSESKPAAQREHPASPGTTRKERTDGPYNPKLTSYSTSNVVQYQSKILKPEPAKITVVRLESNNSDKSESKPAAQREHPASPGTTRKERVETTKKSDNLRDSLDSYLHEDVNRFENHWKDTKPKQAPSQAAPSGSATDGPYNPKLTSYSTSNVVQYQSKILKPEPAKITVVRLESNNSDKSESKPAAQREHPASPGTTRKERVEITKKSENLRDFLASYLHEDGNSFEKSWKTNQPTQSTSQTVTSREKDHSETPKLTSWSTDTESKTSTVRPHQAKITIFHDERQDTNKESSKPVVESCSSTRSTENTDVPDSLKVPHSSVSTSITESTQQKVQTGPGKLSTIKDESGADNSKVSSRSSTTTTTTTRTKYTTETIKESTTPKPAPRMETKAKEAAAVTKSEKFRDLISWSDLEDNTNTRVVKEKPATPTPVPRQTPKDSEKSTGELPLTIVSPELVSNRTHQPTKPAVITSVEKKDVGETRYRVSESLDESESDFSNNPLASGNQRVTATPSETQSERPRTPEQRSSSPRPTPRPRETTNSTGSESRYTVVETLEDTMLEAGPSRSMSRSSVTTTRSMDPVYREYRDDSDNRSTRTVSSSRSKITTSTVERRYGNSSAYEANQYDRQSSNGKGVLFVKEYVDSSESMKSPTATGSISEFSDGFESIPYSSSSSYLYSSAPVSNDEGTCTYCGRKIKDCPKIILEHLNILCHEQCFKCGICHKPMGDLVDSLFIHRDVVHCESCYEKLF